MSSSIHTFTSNWFKVKNPSFIEDYVCRINDGVEYLDSGDQLTMHEYQGKIRLTAFDMIDQTLGFYEDEDCEEWIDLEEEIAGMLEEGEVFRLTSISWFKGRLSEMRLSVHTWDGRQKSTSIDEWTSALSQELEVDSKRLSGWP